MTPPTETLSRAEARHAAVRAQALDAAPGSTDCPREVDDLLDLLGCVQIDAMRAPRRSHELALLARGADPVDTAAMMHRPGPARAFETWGHAHSLISLAVWPFLEFRRRAIRAGGWRGPDVDPEAVRRVRATIETDGPQTLGDLDVAVGRGWERQSPSRWACEWMLSVGDLVCVGRDDRWKRIYSLPETSLPGELLEDAPDDDTCVDWLVGRSLDLLGVATLADVADYFRIHPRLVAPSLQRLEAQQVVVEGSGTPWFVSSAFDPAPVEPTSVIPVSPLDALVWTRPRQQALFDRDYRLESYKPAHRREFGYFGMPLLHGSELVGRVAVRPEGRRLRIEAFEIDEPLTDDLDAELRLLLGRWSDTDDVVGDLR